MNTAQLMRLYDRHIAHAARAAMRNKFEKELRAMELPK